MSESLVHIASSSVGFEESRNNNSFNLKPHAVICCHITFADGRVFQIDIDNKSKGADVLDKVCKIVGVSDESSYFGLQYYTIKMDLCWLNLRNKVIKQMRKAPPFAFYFRIKYFISPHAIQLEETRHQFYLNVAMQLKLGSWSGNSPFDIVGKLIAYMTQIEFGDYNASTTPCKYACFWPDANVELPREVLLSAVEFQKSLTGMERSRLEYNLISFCHEKLTFYGTHFFEAKDCFFNCLICGVSPHGVFICDLTKKEKDFYPFQRIHGVTERNKVIFLILYNDDGTLHSYGYETSGKNAAMSLFRTITEFRIFYHYDAVPKEITDGCASPPKLAFFSTPEKEYLHDILLTMREAQDKARRRLYNLSSALSPINSSMPFADTQGCNLQQMNSSCCSLSETGSGNAIDITIQKLDEENADLRKRLTTFQESLLCRICRDRMANQHFHPCGHSMCCDVCATYLVHCPICRLPIEECRPFYPPWSGEEIAGEINKLMSTEAQHDSEGNNRQQHQQHHHHHQHHHHDLKNPNSNDENDSEKNETSIPVFVCSDSEEKDSPKEADTFTGIAGYSFTPSNGNVLPLLIDSESDINKDVEPKYDKTPTNDTAMGEVESTDFIKINSLNPETSLSLSPSPSQFPLKRQNSLEVLEITPCDKHLRSKSAKPTSTIFHRILKFMSSDDANNSTNSSRKKDIVTTTTTTTSSSLRGHHKTDFRGVGFTRRKESSSSGFRSAQNSLVENDEETAARRKREEEEEDKGKDSQVCDSMAVTVLKRDLSDSHIDRSNKSKWLNYNKE